MNDADRLEEIEKTYSPYWGLSQGDIEWLISTVKEQNREIGELQIKVRMHTTTREAKAEAELAEIRKGNRGMLEVINEQEADNRRLQERVRELEEIYRHCHVGPDRICAQCGKDLTDNLHERLKEKP